MRESSTYKIDAHTMRVSKNLILVHIHKMKSNIYRQHLHNEISKIQQYNYNMTMIPKKKFVSTY